MCGLVNLSLPREMGLEEEAPPLPPRNYTWSDVEDNDEDLFQSDDDLDESSSQISLDDQHAMYSSVSGELEMFNTCPLTLRPSSSSPPPPASHS